MRERSIEDLYYGDEFKQILLLTIDSKDWISDVATVPFVIGALTAFARLEEAFILFDSYSERMTIESRVISRYFLGTAYCRHYQFPKARAYLIANAKDRRLVKDPRSRFFLAQGLGFYRYTFGHLKKAVYWSSRALQLAVLAEFSYGRILAMDLKAHSLINTGQIRIGLRIMEDLQDYARQFGHVQTMQWSGISSLLYRSNHGLLGADAAFALRSQVDDLKDGNSFSRASLLLELAHQQLLGGKADQAKETLDDAAQLVYQVDSPHLEIRLHLRLAFYLFLRGDSVQALSLLRNAIDKLGDCEDKVIEQRARGFEAKILETLGDQRAAAHTLSALEPHNQKTGLATGKRIMGRKNGEYAIETIRGQDPFGDFLDLVHMKSHEAIDEILKNSWFGFLYPVLDILPNESVIYLDIDRSGSLTTFERGNVLHQARPVGHLVRKLLQNLSLGERSKEEIVAAVWGYDYQPQKHNNLIYTLIVNARKSLDSRAAWIEATPQGYAFRAGVVLQQKSAPANLAPLEAVVKNRVDELNFRQKMALARLAIGESIDAEMYRSWFDISEATAVRDLRRLVEDGFMQRNGKARATLYSRIE